MNRFSAGLKSSSPLLKQGAPTKFGVDDPANHTSSANLDHRQPSLADPFINPERLSWVPDATGSIFDAIMDRGSFMTLPEPRRLLHGSLSTDAHRALGGYATGSR
jgi:hypothetical protein